MSIGEPQHDLGGEARRDGRIARSGRQLRDPDEAAAVIVALVDDPTPPAHLLLGSDALKLVRDKLEALRHEIDAHEAITISTDG